MAAIFLVAVSLDDLARFWGLFGSGRNGCGPGFRRGRRDGDRGTND